MRCVIVVHPYSLPQEDTALLTESAVLSCANICIDDSRFSPDFAQRQARDVENKGQNNEISNSAAFITETNQVMWMESTDQHQPVRTNDHVYGDSSD